MQNISSSDQQIVNKIRNRAGLNDWIYERAQGKKE